MSKEYPYSKEIVLLNVIAIAFLIFVLQGNLLAQPVQPLPEPAQAPLSLQDDALDQDTSLSSESSSSQQSDQPRPTLTLDWIFNNEWPTDTNRAGLTEFIFTGDVLLARTVNVKMAKLGQEWPFARIKPWLEAADATAINLETPLTNDCQPTVKGMIFCGSTANVQALLDAGIDIVNIANNHIGNRGPDGVEQTVATLQAAGLTVTGYDQSNLAIKEINGVQFAFLGYNEVDRQTGAAFPDPERIRAEVAEARRRVGDQGVVIVNLHAGIEYTYEPSTRQKQVAHWIIDAGADMVVGHHPHWYQDVEVYNGKLIIYSLGNLVFDQMWSQETRQGFMAKVLFDGHQLVAIKFIPIMIEEYGQPHVVEDAAGEAQVEHLRDISRP